MDPATAMNIAICEALGLDPERIPRGGVTISLDAAGPIVTVDYRIRDHELGALLSGFKHYKLVPADDQD